MKIKRIIIVAIICLLLPMMVSGQSYVPVGPTTDLNGDVNVPTGSGYYINGIEFTVASGINSMESPCIVTGGEITKGTVGTFTVAAITEAYLRNAATATSPLESVTLAIQSNQTIAEANKMYYVIFTYGSPCTISINETLPNGWNAIPLGRVVKDTAGVCHYLSAGFRFGNGMEKGHIRAKKLRGVELSSGGTLTYSTVDKDFESTALVAFGGYNEFTCVDYVSGDTDFRYLYDDGTHTAWTEVGAQSLIDYAHYDDGDGTLGTISNNKYGCHWVYRHVGDSDIYVVYGTTNGSLAEALLAQPPNVPNHLTLAGVLLGCIVVKQDGLVYEIQMVTDTMFTGTSVGDHNSLGGIDGGAADDYYHMTSAEHTIATQAADTTNSGYLLTADWDTFNEKADAGANSDITSITGLTTPLGAAYGGTGIANGAGETITLVGDDAITFTTTAATGVTLPTSGTLYGTLADSISSANLLSSMSDETGTGKLVFGTSPIFTTNFAVNHANNPYFYLNDAATSRSWKIQTYGTVFNMGITYGTASISIDNTGHLGINTVAPSGDFDINTATDSDPHILLSENDATKWDIYNDHNDDDLQVKAGATLRYEFGTDGTANADVAWGTFSPVVEGEGKELLAIAMEDAGKPVKPYVGIPIVKTDDELFDMIPTEYQVEQDKLDKEEKPVLDKDGKVIKEIVTKVKDEKVFRDRLPNEFATEVEKQVEYDKYHKVPAKISIANAKYLDYLTGVIDTMQAKIDLLEARIVKLEPIEPIKK